MRRKVVLENPLSCHRSETGYLQSPRTAGAQFLVVGDRGPVTGKMFHLTEWGIPSKYLKNHVPIISSEDEKIPTEALSLWKSTTCVMLPLSAMTGTELERSHRCVRMRQTNTTPPLCSTITHCGLISMASQWPFSSPLLPFIALVSRRLVRLSAPRPGVVPSPSPSRTPFILLHSPTFP